MLSILTYAWSRSVVIHTGLMGTMRVVTKLSDRTGAKPRLRAPTSQAVPEKLRYGLSHKNHPA
ncbi:hypothetical protein Apa02nite_016230 [Actinoplanes palleronii]|uniref:Uncharacterized protein n=1 Tax=Actinoplanes palleronii TaxID=113570 RepID=A0ABQ4B5J2_9ACTN|nr:hypothetical protein Apa02nite_016230 [Actinoplanes palleronii]